MQFLSLQSHSVPFSCIFPGQRCVSHTNGGLSCITAWNHAGKRCWKGVHMYRMQVKGYDSCIDTKHLQQRVLWNKSFHAEGFWTTCKSSLELIIYRCPVPAFSTDVQNMHLLELSSGLCCETFWAPTDQGQVVISWRSCSEREPGVPEPCMSVCRCEVK